MMFMIDELLPEERQRQEALSRVAGCIAAIGTHYERLIACSALAQRLLHEAIDERIHQVTRALALTRTLRKRGVIKLQPIEICWKIRFKPPADEPITVQGNGAMAKKKPKLESSIVQLRWQNNTLGGQLDGETMLVVQIDTADYGNDADAVLAYLARIAKERKAEIPEGWWPQIRLCGNSAEAQARLVSLIRGIR